MVETVLKRELPRVQEGVLRDGLPEPVAGMRQRRLGGYKVEPKKQGDCWATAVASLAGLTEKDRNELHRRILISDSRVRKNDGDPFTGGNWWNVTLRWLWEHDLRSIGVIYGKPEAEKVYIASGPGSRGSEHAILAYGNGEMFSDPHPDQEGLLEITEWVGWWTP